MIVSQTYLDWQLQVGAKRFVNDSSDHSFDWDLAWQTTLNFVLLALFFTFKMTDKEAYSGRRGRGRVPKGLLCK